MSILRHFYLNISAKIKRTQPPQPCVLCGTMTHDGLWCAACNRALPYHDVPQCPVCALPTPAGEVCGHCLQQQPRFTRTTAVFSYRFPLDQLIQALKYRDQLALAHAFAIRLAARVDPAQRPDCVIPMPLHPAKLRARGFNQSLLLAAKVARTLDLKLLPQACQRVRDTPPQSSLPWQERQRNVRKAFRCDVDLTGQRVVLVDDVMTSGASLNALAEAVHRRGAREIWTWVAARTLPHDR